MTDASVHDSQMFAQVLDIDNESDDIWADSAYYSVNLEAVLAILGYISHIHERGYRNHPLNEEQKASNREKSKTRAKVEHVARPLGDQYGWLCCVLHRHHACSSQSRSQSIELQPKPLCVFAKAGNECLKQEECA